MAHQARFLKDIISRNDAPSQADYADVVAACAGLGQSIGVRIYFQLWRTQFFLISILWCLSTFDATLCICFQLTSIVEYFLMDYAQGLFWAVKFIGDNSVCFCARLIAGGRLDCRIANAAILDHYIVPHATSRSRSRVKTQSGTFSDRQVNRHLLVRLLATDTDTHTQTHAHTFG